MLLVGDTALVPDGDDEALAIVVGLLVGIIEGVGVVLGSAEDVVDGVGDTEGVAEAVVVGLGLTDVVGLDVGHAVLIVAQSP